MKDIWEVHCVMEWPAESLKPKLKNKINKIDPENPGMEELTVNMKNIYTAVTAAKGC